jgi:hypothetical protein
MTGVGGAAIVSGTVDVLGVAAADELALRSATGPSSVRATRTSAASAQTTSALRRHRRHIAEVSHFAHHARRNPLTGGGQCSEGTDVGEHPVPEPDDQTRAAPGGDVSKQFPDVVHCPISFLTGCGASCTRMQSAAQPSHLAAAWGRRNHRAGRCVSRREIVRGAQTLRRPDRPLLGSHGRGP